VHAIQRPSSSDSGSLGVLRVTWATLDRAADRCRERREQAPLSLGDVETGHIESDAWRYYYLNVPRIDAGVRFMLTATGSDPEANEKGVQLYVRRSSPPTAVRALPASLLPAPRSLRFAPSPHHEATVCTTAA
jgi:hypothetical protein